MVIPAWLLLAALAVPGCGGDTGPVDDPGARIIVAISTAGFQLDGDGYVLGVGPKIPVRVAANEEYTFPVEPGSYLIQLTDLAPNCSTAENSILVEVGEGKRVQASFHVTCRLALGPARSHRAHNGRQQ